MANRDFLDTILMDAVHAGCEGRDPTPALAELADRQAGPAWCALVTTRVVGAFCDALTMMLHAGWEPRDLAAILRRKVSPAASELAVPVLTGALRRRHPDGARAARWEAQLRELAGDARAVDTESPTWETDIGWAVAAIGFASHLGSLPDLATPARAGAKRDLDQNLLDKVRALLAKAEATTFEEEAHAFLSKAQELMTRHNLDRAALQEAEPGGDTSIEARRCWLDDPYVKQKGFLLAVVAGANRCRSVSLYEYGLLTIFGHPDDLDATEMLFTALLVHATKQMALPARSGLGKRGPSLPSYRRSFLIAYATRIGARLKEAATAATDAAVASAGDALVPVLAARERGVDEALRKMFPTTTKSDFSITDAAGWAAGMAAADMADLSGHAKLAGATT